MENKLKRANEYFGVSDDIYKKTGAFNPVIGVDSLFFVDTLLLSKTSVPEIKDGLQEIRKYFSDIIILLKSNSEKARQQALGRLVLREVKGIGIGYGNASDDGSAIGPELAKRLLLTAEELIKIGIDNPAIFEVMGLFEEDFGPDRLSDGLIRILLKKLYKYSERVTGELSISETFIQKTYEHNYTLAKHPLKNGPLIFIPNDILRDLPIANNFDEISNLVNFNKELREKFNQIISPCFFVDNNKKKPSKSEIKKYLLEDKERIKT